MSGGPVFINCHCGPTCRCLKTGRNCCPSSCMRGSPSMCEEPLAGCCSSMGGVPSTPCGTCGKNCTCGPSCKCPKGCGGNCCPCICPGCSDQTLS
ncbi:hypothetical protein EMCRGX_G027085 [Ephydatia muelleri]|eukprot:Em0014g145a